MDELTKWFALNSERNIYIDCYSNYYGLLDGDLLREPERLRADPDGDRLREPAERERLRDTERLLDRDPIYSVYKKKSFIILQSTRTGITPA